MEYKDYYAILGVPRNASDKEIKAAFKRLARKYHPDVNPGNRQAEEKFKEINEAYQVLSNPEARRRYDSLGPNWQEGPGPGAGPRTYTWTYNTGPGGADLGDFSEFFRTVFGDMGMPGMPDLDEILGSRARRRVRRTVPEHLLQISLEEAYTGTVKHVELSMPDESGRVVAKRLDITVPRGVTNGQRLRVAGAGPGDTDVYFRIQFAPHPQLQVDGRDILYEATVPMTTCALGGEIEVPSVWGKTIVKVPPGTQCGQTLRLRGLGLPGRAGEPDGDELVRVRVSVPTRLTPTQRQLLEKLRETL